MSIFTGSGVAIITPFTQDGVNFDAFAQHIEFQISGGTDAIVVCGTTGEPSTMTEQEKSDTIRFCVEQVRGRVPVIAGAGGNNTKKAIDDSKKAQELGADALLHVTPYYNKCTQSGLLAHFNAIADAVSIPIVVYNVPSRTGVNALPETVKKITAHKNVVAIKEASANIEQITELARLCPDLDIYSGNDDHILPLLSLGGKGVISVLANVAPRPTHDIVAAFMAGDIQHSRQLQFQYNPLVKALFSEVNPIPVKAAVGMLGFDVGEPRLPLTPLSPAPMGTLKKEMAALGLL